MSYLIGRICLFLSCAAFIHLAMAKPHGKKHLGKSMRSNWENVDCTGVGAQPLEKPNIDELRQMSDEDKKAFWIKRKQKKRTKRICAIKRHKATLQNQGM